MCRKGIISRSDSCTFQFSIISTALRAVLQAQQWSVIDHPYNPIHPIRNVADPQLYIIYQQRVSRSQQKLVESQQESQQKSVESMQKSVESQLKSVESPQKSVESQQKSVESPQKSVESQLKSLESPQKSVESQKRVSIFWKLVVIYDNQYQSVLNFYLINSQY